MSDVVHGFDSANWRNKYLWGDEEARIDAEMKTMAYQREVAEWLWGGCLEMMVKVSGF